MIINAQYQAKRPFNFTTRLKTIDFHRKYHNPSNVGEGSGIWRNIGDEAISLRCSILTVLYNVGGSNVGDFWYGERVWLTPDIQTNGFIHNSSMTNSGSG
jgi:hypothetical protein